MDKKNLDELFREKFRDFREVPDQKVWTAIERSLDKKQKRRVIPLWWKLGGVAAVLAVALIALYPFEDAIDELPIITDTKNEPVDDKNMDGSDSDKKDDGARQRKDALSIPETTEGVVVDGSEEIEEKNTEGFTGSDIGESSAADDSEKNGHTVTKEKPNSSERKGKYGNRNPENTQLAGNEENAEGLDKTERLKDRNLTTISTDSLNTGDKNAVATSDDNGTKDTPTARANAKTTADDRIAATEKDSSPISEESREKVAQNDIPIQDGVTKNRLDLNKEGVVQNDSTVNPDNTSKAPKKSILEAFEATEEEEIAETSGSRWSAGASVAPVYFNATGEGSPIDPGLSPNSKSGNTNLSYGVSVAYAVTEKLSLRSGIHKTEYGYDTNEVAFSPTLTNSSNGRLQNIDYTDSSGNLALESTISTSDFAGNAAQELGSSSAIREGSVAQSFGYLEVPLELDYALIDRKIGVNLIGGVSSLFLLDNSVTLNAGELTSEIGEASNLNSFNLSTNVGFGLNYKFTPKIRLNIEPVFKYQLNTFSNVSGDFRPFSIGVYSGLNFRF